jgi:hypothetical protein
MQRRGAHSMRKSRPSIRFVKLKAAENQNDRKRKLAVQFISLNRNRPSRNQCLRSSIWTSHPKPKSKHSAASDRHSQNELLPIATHSVLSAVSTSSSEFEVLQNASPRNSLRR